MIKLYYYIVFSTFPLQITFWQPPSGTTAARDVKGDIFMQMPQMLRRGNQAALQPLTPLVDQKGQHKGGVWRRQALLAPVVLITSLALWTLAVTIAKYPAFILPAPGLVFARLWAVVQDGSLWFHSLITLGEISCGLAAGLTISLLLGYFLGKSRWLEELTAPYIVASQSVPIVAIAPLLVIWFGTGVMSKIVVCALIVFFPMLINTIVGIRSIDTNLRELMRSLNATRWQTLVKLEVPAALPNLLGGLKIAVTLSVAGAVVGEFVGSDRGLGYLVNLGRGIFDTPLIFVAIFTLVVIALLMYAMVLILEYRLLHWQK
jgi:NitT/TauT family transport system permease protein